VSNACWCASSHAAELPLGVESGRLAIRASFSARKTVRRRAGSGGISAGGEAGKSICDCRAPGHSNTRGTHGFGARRRNSAGAWRRDGCNLATRHSGDFRSLGRLGLSITNRRLKLRCGRIARTDATRPRGPRIHISRPHNCGVADPGSGIAPARPTQAESGSLGAWSKFLVSPLFSRCKIVLHVATLRLQDLRGDSRCACSCPARPNLQKYRPINAYEAIRRRAWRALTIDFAHGPQLRHGKIYYATSARLPGLCPAPSPVSPARRSFVMNRQWTLWLPPAMRSPIPGSAGCGQPRPHLGQRFLCHGPRRGPRLFQSLTGKRLDRHVHSFRRTRLTRSPISLPHGWRLPLRIIFSGEEPKPGTFALVGGRGRIAPRGARCR